MRLPACLAALLSSTQSTPILASLTMTEIRAINDDASTLAILMKLRIVIRTAQQHSTWIEKQCGVNGTQLWIMQELFDAGALRVGEIAKKLAIHQTTTSNLLDALEKRDYITKARDRSDQRVVQVKLTPAGKALLARAPRPARGLLPTALEKLDASTLQNLNDALQGLLDSFDLLDEKMGMLPLPFMM
jgi:DNA-binding MarR family transcriptional regulator